MKTEMEHLFYVIFCRDENVRVAEFESFSIKKDSLDIRF